MSTTERHSNFIQQMNLAKKKADNCHLKTAIAIYEDALAESPLHTSFIAYNLGSLYFHQVGNGLLARNNFLTAYSRSMDSLEVVSQAQVDEIKAASAENLVQLSLSWEEYCKWANRLRKLKPTHPIFGSQLLSAENMVDSGATWGEILESFANDCFDPRESGQDLGRHGQAASILHLIVEYPAEVEADRALARRTLWTFASLKHYMFTSCGIGIEKRGLPVDVEQFKLIIDDVLPQLSNYVHANPNDEDILKIWKDINDTLEAVIK